LIGAERSEQVLLEELARLRARLASLEAAADRTATLPREELEEALNRMAYGAALLLNELAECQQIEQSYQTVVEDMPALICRFAPDGTLTFVNEHYCRYFSRSRRELVGHNFFEFIPEDQREGVRVHYAGLTPGRPSVTYEHSVIAPDGSLRWQRWTDRALFDHAGRAIEYQSIGADITEQKQAEQVLRESEQKFRALAEQSPNMIFINKEGRIVYANAAAEAALGYTREEFYAPDFDLRCLIAPENHAAVEASFSAHLRGEEVSPSDYVLLARDGRCIPAILSTRLIDYEGGKAILGIATDITERKHVEEQREKLIEELDAFAHTVAHDLKAPLSVIVGFADLIVTEFSEGLEPELAEYLTKINQFAQKVSAIVDELLLLSSVRDADVPITPLDMGPLVAAAQQRLALEIKQQQATISAPETWPAALGYGPWVEEVWTNYLSNALRHAGPSLRIDLGAQPQPDGMVRFWVRDSGQGIEPEVQARLFKPYTAAGRAGARGHGLGLSIVRRIVERLGGKVGVESEVGRGSTFFFTLPAAQA
jgi:PAS domain S-box-containing protein